MAFLKKSIIKNMVAQATVERHPMLSAGDVPLSIRQSYFQGCVLVALLDDEKITETERSALTQLGLSLELPTPNIEEGITLVCGLSNDEDKAQFVADLVASLKESFYPSYFIKDVKALLSLGSAQQDERDEWLNYFGSLLLGKADGACVASEGDAGSSPNDDRSTAMRGSSKSRDKECRVLGIDFGTANCQMAVLQDVKPILVANAEGEYTTPSVVAVAESGKVLIGLAAKNQILINPENTVHSFLRFIGRRYSELSDVEKNQIPYHLVETENGCIGVDLSGRILSIEEIAALLLRKLKKDAEKSLDCSVLEVVIAVPVWFNLNNRAGLRLACKLAGLGVKGMEDAPSTAALAYGFGNKKCEKVAVCDFGTGGLNVAVVDMGDGVYEVKAVNSDVQIGGIGIDDAVYSKIASMMEWNDVVSGISLPVAKARLMDAVVKAKEELSTVSSCNMMLPCFPDGRGNLINYEHVLERKRLEEYAGFHISMVEVCCNPCMIEAEFDKVDTLIVLGGLSHMPALMHAAQGAIKSKRCVNLAGSGSVALGCAIRAGIKQGTVSDALTLDVLAHSLGIETLGGVMTPIVLRNTTQPTKAMQVFSTAADNQPAVTISVFQGESKKTCENICLGSYNLEGIPPAPKGVPQIEVEFDIDANSTLNVSARDQGTGRKMAVNIAGSVEYAEELVARMMRDVDELWAQF